MDDKISVSINEVSINQDAEGFDPTDAIGLDNEVQAVVIRNAFNSTQNLLIGWNQAATEANMLPPGSSIVYERVGRKLDGNKLYVGFQGASGGKGLITIYNDNC